MIKLYNNHINTRKWLQKTFACTLISLALLFSSIPLSASEQSQQQALVTAAENSDTDAQYNLGLMYENGDGVPRDYREAAKWFRKVAEQGVAKAQTSLGWLYDYGRGVTENDVKAVKWYRKAAEQGHAAAQYNLGLMYDYGEGVAENDINAYMWTNLAAVKGHKNAENNKQMLSRNMTQLDITKASTLTLQCLENNYKNCG